MPRTIGIYTTRDYQDQAEDAIFNWWEAGHRSGLIVLPTGCGKTVLMGAICERRAADRKRTMVVAHRDNLIMQNRAKIMDMGLTVATEQGKETAFEGSGLFGEWQVVVASKQTLSQKRLQKWDHDAVDTILIDEAHHATAAGYTRIMNWFPRAKVLGVTATPVRGDDDDLGQVFEGVPDGPGRYKPVYEMTLSEAIGQQHLAPIEVHEIDTGIDLSEVRVAGGDLDDDEIAKLISPKIEYLVNAVKKEGLGDRPAVLFASTTATAEAFADAFNKIGINARAMCGEDTDAWKTETDRMFATGEIQVLCLCQMYTEGWDAPWVEAVIIARPTESVSLYSQMVGRGTRKCPPKKTNCWLIDLAMISRNHSLVRPVHLFATPKEGHDDDAIMEEAQKLLTEGKERDPMKAIVNAEKVVRYRQRMSVIARERDVRYKRAVYDALSVVDTGLIAYRKSDFDPTRPASEKQVEQLKKMGIDQAEKLSARGAQRYLKVLFQRQQRGLSSHRQVSALQSFGLRTDYTANLTKQEASDKMREMIYAASLLKDDRG